MAVFDEIAECAFSNVLNVMGENAARQSSSGGYEEGRVLFKCPTQSETVGDNYEYKPNTPTAEYYKGTFNGLKQNVDKQNNEFLLIRGSKYLVTSVETKYDGDTFIANLELVNK